MSLQNKGFISKSKKMKENLLIGDGKYNEKRHFCKSLHHSLKRIDNGFVCDIRKRQEDRGERGMKD